MSAAPWLDEQQERDEIGQRVHAKNLKMCTVYLHRKGVWRIRLNQMCEVYEVVSGAKGGPPVSGEISFKTLGDGTQPSFGSLARLNAGQTTYAEFLIMDLKKITQAREVAKTHEQAMQAAGVGAESDSLSKQHLEKMTATVGELPASQTEVHEARRQQEAEEAASRARQLEADRREALIELGVAPAGGGECLSVDEVLEKDRARAQKKAQKKARQRAKKREARQEGGAEGDEGGDDDEAAVDDEVAAFEALMLGGGGPRQVRVGNKCVEGVD